MKKSIAIIGAGISGISLAFYLNEYRKNGEDIDITVFEATNTSGGCIRSVSQAGYLMESGPNGVLTSKAHFAELFAAAGLSNILEQSSDLTTRRYIQLHNKLNLAPAGPIGALTTPLLSFASKLRVLKEPFIAKNASNAKPADLVAEPADLVADESVYDFAVRRLGKGMADNLISTLIGGIYAGDAKKLSLKSAFPWMYRLERDYGGLFKGMIGRMKALKAERKKIDAARKRRAPSRLISSATGMQGLVSALAKSCDGVNFHYNCPVSKLEKAGEQYILQTPSGEFRADKVISCCNAHEAALLFKSLDAELAAAFDKVQFAPIFICGMGFDRAAVGHPLDGFGYLIAPAENSSTLGTLFSSSLYRGRAPEGKVLLTSITVGDRGENRALFKESDSTLSKMAYEAAKSVLQLKTEPEIYMTFRTERAIPQYYIGHEKIVDTIEAHAKALGGIHICGNTTSGISVADCVQRSLTIAKEIIA